MQYAEGLSDRQAADAVRARIDGKEARRALAETIGQDGVVLLRAIYPVDSPTWLRAVPAVETPRRMWIQQYVMVDDTLRWRTEQDGVPRRRSFSVPRTMSMRITGRSTQRCGWATKCI